MSRFLCYIPGDSIMHRMYPTVKLMLALIISASCFLTDKHLLIVGLIGLSLLIGVAGRVFARSCKTLITLGLLGLFLFVLQALSIRQGDVLVLLPLGLRLTGAGLRFSSLLSLRLIGATLPLSVVLSVTPVSAVTHALTEDLRIPYRYAFALTTAIRFIPILSAEMHDVVEAQTARGLELDGGLMKKASLLLPLCAPMLISAVKRVESSAISAELRGFHLRVRRGGQRRYTLAKPDFGALVLCFVLPVLSVWM